MQTIEVNGVPWFVCDAISATEPMEVAEKSGIDPATVNVRQSTSGEASVLAVDRLMAVREGRDPFKIFGVRL